MSEQTATETVSTSFTQMLPPVSTLQPFRQLMNYYSCAMMEVETKFRVLDLQLSLSGESNPIESIKTRLKKPESIISKAQKRGIPLTYEAIEANLFDIAGVRVVCSFQDDIYRLADSLLQQDDVRLIERKDYIANPKPNGYRSLHLIIEVPIFLQNEKRLMKVEVQLRTIAMDFWASLEHKMRYKKGIDRLKNYEQIASQLQMCAEMSSILDKQMQVIRNEIEQDLP